MLSVISIFIWIITGPRSLAAVTPYIQKELNSISPGTQVTISDSYIKWDSFLRTFSIEVNDVNIMNDTNDIIASFPQISFDFSILRFVRGQFLSSDLTIIKPSLYIDTSQKTLYVTSPKGAAIQKAIAERLAIELKSSAYSFPINSVHLKDARVYIDNGMSEFIWEIKDAYAKVETIKKQNKIISEFNINFGTDSTYFGSEIYYTADGSIDTKIKFTEIPSYVVQDLFPHSDYLKEIQLRTAGDINLLLTPEGDISQVEFSLTNISGSVNLPQYFKDPLNIKSMLAQGSLYNNFSVLTLNKVAANIDDSDILISGTITNHATLPEISPAIKAEVTVNHVDVDKVANYWPESLGPIAREWVTANISGGKVTGATGTFVFTPDDFNKMRSWNSLEHQDPSQKLESPISDDAINATINVEGANVSYYAGYPEIKDITGVVKFTGNTMYVNASKATVLNTAVNNASLVMENMWHHHTALDIRADFSGTAEDGIAFLKAGLKDVKTPKELESIYKSTGLAEGNVTLSIPLEENLLYKDMKLEVNAKFSKTTVPEIINGHSLSDAEFNLALKNFVLDIDGKGVINGTPLTIGLNRDFEKENEAKYHVAGEISAKYLADLNFGNIPFISDNFAVDVTMTQQGADKLIEGTADITKATVSIPNIGFNKAAGVNAKIAFSAKQNEDEIIEIKSFNAEGDGLAAAGSMTIANSELTQLSIEKGKFANNDFSLNYSSDAKGSKVDIHGSSLDLGNVSFGKFFEGGDDKTKKSLDLKANIEKLYMKNSEVINKFSANVICSAKICTSASANGKLQNGSVTLSLKPVKNRFALVVESDNAGTLINAMGISENIKGGKLNINASFADTNNKVVAQGSIVMRDFVAVKTPLLGKVLTLASLQGIGDMLNNQGITFKKFEAPFTLASGVISVTDAKSSGSSLGITASGTVDMTKGEVDIKGVIIPASAINQAFGKIPLIGNLLVGKKNEGLIATRYRIKGPYDDVKATVNPLSILTPGVLRNLFDIGD